MDMDEIDTNPLVIVDGAVDTATPGIYTVTYIVVDSGNNTVTAERVVTVTAADMPPILELQGDNPMELFVGDEYIDPGYLVMNDMDTNPLVIVDGAVDTATPGIYHVTYIVVDSGNNTVTADRTVNVLEITPPP